MKYKNLKTPYKSSQMKKEKIEKIVERSKHIPTDEIKQDILDTQNEITQMEKEAEFLASTPMGMQETRWNHMRADARISGIEDRKKFIEKLQAILDFREKNLKKP